MDWQTAFNVSAGALGLLGGWVLKTLWEAMRDVRKDVSSLRETIPETYVRRDSFIEFRRELFSQLNRIEDKIDGKADKQ